MKFSQILFLSALLLMAGCDLFTKSGDDDSPILKCTDGLSDEQYSCKNIDLVAHVDANDLLGTPLENGNILNDIWGWTDPETGKEYALVGLVDGVTFVDISTPSEPVVVGKLNEAESVAEKATGYTQVMDHGKSTWRDFKVYQNHLYVVSDGQSHGLQVFDLTRLRNVDNPPATFGEDAVYEEFGNAHNIAINEETGFAYVGGSDTYGGGLHIVNLHDQKNPRFAGFHSDSTVGINSTGYVHDMQCVTYIGPDSDYQGDEICMNSSETHLMISNVTNKSDVTTISAATYDGSGDTSGEIKHYAHQGWLTEDHRYFLLDDELDEWDDGNNTRTYIWDVQDLDNPELIGIHEAAMATIDHNQYIKGNYVYQANYTAGLSIKSLENIVNGELEEVAYFDTFPQNNDAEFEGAWSNYPFFESGVIVVSDISNGLFLLQPNL